VGVPRFERRGRFDALEPILLIGGRRNAKSLRDGAESVTFLVAGVSEGEPLLPLEGGTGSLGRLGRRRGRADAGGEEVRLLGRAIAGPGDRVVNEVGRAVEAAVEVAAGLGVGDRKGRVGASVGGIGVDLEGCKHREK
jgi:hypothetical protein